jgi:hypothetical protein
MSEGELAPTANWVDTVGRAVAIEETRVVIVAADVGEVAARLPLLGRLP